MSQKDKLRKILKRAGSTQNDLAELLGITYQSVSIKMNGKKDFTQSEIFRIMVIYKLTPEEVVDIFFSGEYRDDIEEAKQREIEEAIKRQFPSMLAGDMERLEK